VESYGPEAAFNRSSLKVKIPESLPGRWERLALEQIVSNLISNAIKFGAGAPIGVTLPLENEEDSRVRFEVRDRGIGIASDDQKRIFGRFERLSAQPGHPAGAGVG